MCILSLSLNDRLQGKMAELVLEPVMKEDWRNGVYKGKGTELSANQGMAMQKALRLKARFCSAVQSAYCKCLYF